MGDFGLELPGLHEGAEETLAPSDTFGALLLGNLIVLTQGLAGAPFIYTLF